MPLVSAEVLLVNYEVMIGVQLPKPTIKHIKVLVAKVLSDLIDVILCGNLVKNTE
jgi:hypothetical protein